MSITLIRTPRIQGRPPHWRGFTVILCIRSEDINPPDRWPSNTIRLVSCLPDNPIASSTALNLRLLNDAVNRVSALSHRGSIGFLSFCALSWLSSTPRHDRHTRLALGQRYPSRTPNLLPSWRKFSRLNPSKCLTRWVRISIRHHTILVLPWTLSDRYLPIQ
jgi:hypothetical protein